jgi:hypothetical protein
LGNSSIDYLLADQSTAGKLGWLNIHMKLVNQILSLAPTPVFLLGGFVSWFGPTSVCSTSWMFMSEMTAMWFIMGLAHSNSWVIFWERRRYVKLQQLPVKQQ